MKFSPTQTNPEVSIWSPNIPAIDRTRPDRCQNRFMFAFFVKFVIISFIPLILTSFLLCTLMYIISSSGSCPGIPTVWGAPLIFTRNASIALHLYIIHQTKMIRSRCKCRCVVYLSLILGGTQILVLYTCVTRGFQNIP